MSTMPYDTGGEDGWGDDGYAVSPTAVSPGPVSPDVSCPASPGVSCPASPGVSPDGDGGGQGNDGPLPGVGRWELAADDPPGRPAGSGLRLRGHLEAMAGSELLGGGPGGLLAELADPHPETMRQHWEHVTGHPWRPEGPWGSAGFVAGHLAVTGPAKAVGKSLTAIGVALVFAGMRADWAGDRFIRTVTPVVIAVTLIVIILVFA